MLRQAYDDGGIDDDDDDDDYYYNYSPPVSALRSYYDHPRDGYYGPRRYRSERDYNYYRSPPSPPPRVKTQSNYNLKMIIRHKLQVDIKMQERGEGI